MIVNIESPVRKVIIESSLIMKRSESSLYELMIVSALQVAEIRPGSEDHELVCRLINNGVRKRTIKFAGIVFHLHHELHGTDNLSNNRSILNETKIRKLTWCDKGIIQN